MDHVEDSQQVLLTRDEDLFLKSLTPECRIIGERQLERRLERYEHNHKVHRLATVLDILRIVLARQFVHMTAHTLDVLLQIAFFFLGRLSIHIFLVSHERHLRVDDSILSLRIVQDHIGLHLLARLVVLQGAPHFVAQTSLNLVVSTLRKSLTGQKIAQDNLPHVTTHLIVAPEHIGQALSPLTQLLGLLHHLQHLLTERGRVGCTLFLVLADGLLHIRDGILQGLRDTRHRLCVRLFQFRGTALEHLLCHVHKLCITLLLLLLLLLTNLVYLLAHQFQLAPLTLSTGMQLPVLCLQMVHPAGGGIQLLSFH